jgi:hypothetical protein
VFEPVVRHDTEIHDRGDSSRWTVGYRAARHLAAGPLAAVRRAATTALLEARDDGALQANFTTALRALEGCEFGQFHPAQTVDVLTREWQRKHEDFKGGDPRRGTARQLRYDRQYGTCLVPCAVVAQSR